MFRHLGDDVVAALAVHLGDALDGQVIALGGAGSENDLLRRRADQLRDLLAGRLDRLFRFPPEGVVAARRVSKLGGEVRHHRFQHAGIQRAGGVIIHVNRQTHPCRHIHLAQYSAHRVSILNKCLPFAPCATAKLFTTLMRQAPALRSVPPRFEPPECPDPPNHEY